MTVGAFVPYAICGTVPFVTSNGIVAETAVRTPAGLCGRARLACIVADATKFRRYLRVWDIALDDPRRL